MLEDVITFLDHKVQIDLGIVIGEELEVPDDIGEQVGLLNVGARGRERQVGKMNV